MGVAPSHATELVAEQARQVPALGPLVWHALPGCAVHPASLTHALQVFDDVSHHGVAGVLTQSLFTAQPPEEMLVSANDTVAGVVEPVGVAVTL